MDTIFVLENPSNWAICWKHICSTFFFATYHFYNTASVFNFEGASTEKLRVSISILNDFNKYCRKYIEEGFFYLLLKMYATVEEQLY